MKKMVDLRIVYKEKYMNDKKEADERFIESAEAIAMEYRCKLEKIDEWYKDKKKEIENNPFVELPRSCIRCPFVYSEPWIFEGSDSGDFISHCSFTGQFVDSSSRTRSDYYKKRRDDCPLDKS